MTPSFSIVRPRFFCMAELSTFLFLRGAGASNPRCRSGQPLELPKLEFLWCRFWCQVIEKLSGLCPRDVFVRQALDDDDTPSATRKRHHDLVSRSDGSMRFAVVAVDVDPASFAGGLGLGPGLVQAGDIEPDVQANRLHLIHLLSVADFPSVSKGFGRSKSTQRR